jgi:GDP-mannose transporter
MAANQSYAKVAGDEEEEKYSNGVEATSQIPTTSTATPASLTNSPMVAILSYCGSSILMTVTNKYVLGGRDFNLNFFLLCVQVCCKHHTMVQRLIIYRV